MALNLREAFCAFLRETMPHLRSIGRQYWNHSMELITTLSPMVATTVSTAWAREEL